ncbi:MAG: NAD(P)H-binding protein [Nitrospinae bacterium]|nr:NAD(P)H-binding protein [Nitrospinota bacterium]
MKVLVTVATQLVKQLAGKGVQVRAGVHNPEKAKGLSMKNVEVVPFELTDVASLENAVKGVDKAFVISAPIMQNRTELDARLVDLAKKAGVKHIVKMSAMECEVEPGIQRRPASRSSPRTTHPGFKAHAKPRRT